MNNNLSNPLEQELTDLLIKIDCVSTAINALNAYFEAFAPDGLTPYQTESYLHASNLAFIASEYAAAARSAFIKLDGEFWDRYRRECMQIDIDATVVISASMKENTVQHHCKEREKETAK